MLANPCKYAKVRLPVSALKVVQEFSSLLSCCYPQNYIEIYNSVADPTQISSCSFAGQICSRQQNIAIHKIVCDIAG